MGKSIFLLILSLAAVPASYAGFGNGSSGGGFAVVCRDASGAIQSARLLDLYEAEVSKGFTFPAPVGSLEGDYVRAVQNTYRLQGGTNVLVGKETRENLARFMEITRFTAPGERLPRLHDFGRTVPMPFGCALEQLAVFDDLKREVRVDSEIWSAMDTLHRAALVSHELFYWYQRSLFERTSENTRALVACIYTTSAIPSLLDGVPSRSVRYGTLELDSNRSEIEAKSTHFYVLENPGTGVTLQFFNIMGRTLVTKSTVELPGITWQVSSGRDAAGRPACVVKEPGISGVIRVPVQSLQRSDWELEIHYKTGERVKIGLIQQGVLLEEAFVSFCP